MQYFCGGKEKKALKKVKVSHIFEEEEKKSMCNAYSFILFFDNTINCHGFFSLKEWLFKTLLMSYNKSCDLIWLGLYVPKTNY